MRPQVHEKRNNRRQRGPGPPHRAVAPTTTQPSQAAATSQSIQADAGGPIKRQKLQPAATATMNSAKPSLNRNAMHGYDADLANPAPSQQQQPRQPQLNQQSQEPKQPHQNQSQSSSYKAASPLVERTAGGKHGTVVKGALAKLQESGEPF